MSAPLRFLIIDGYPRNRRDELVAAGITPAWKLHVHMLLRHLPNAEYDILFPCDNDAAIPSGEDLERYDGLIWTGSCLSVTDSGDPRIRVQIELARCSFEQGVPGWGSCWGLQIGAVAAGGEVSANPRGKEVGIARKISQTADAHQGHPMFVGKPHVFEAFCIHDDMVSRIPEGGVLLASNSFTQVQALAIAHKKGVLWGTQYHLEYDLREITRMMVLHQEQLIGQGFFSNADDLSRHADKMEALYKETHRKDLRWQLGIDDDVLSDDIRQREFANWIHRLVMPRAAQHGKGEG
ncbi:MAG: type 1 glutamine amidotransferase [Thermoplasmata archaeon]|nr:MAG: type 1 glutamine amidotransferase [Thermoplasmata archaeon]